MSEKHANPDNLTINFNDEEVRQPSQERLQAAFSYDPDGFLIHLEGKRAGRRAGGPKLVDGYAVVSFDGKTSLIHRLIWIWHAGKIPAGLHIDHIDGTAENNRIENLRLVTPSLNRKNSGLRCDNKSGVVGVSYYPRCPRKPWVASANGKALGYFGTVEDAAKASIAARQGRGFTERHLANSILPSLGNAHDDTAETIRGRIDHDKAHGVRPVKSPQKVGAGQ